MFRLLLRLVGIQYCKTIIHRGEYKVGQRTMASGKGECIITHIIKSSFRTKYTMGSANCYDIYGIPNQSIKSRR